MPISSTVVHSVEWLDWTINVVEDSRGFWEYMIVRPDGPTVEFSDAQYGAPAVALRDGLVRLFIFIDGAEQTMQSLYALTGPTHHMDAM